eukprot:TRINITY_DN666_c1_g1_i1.p1 TRINITY_DN666_c1_g1~~TRINITY_DN666_c1_g1_i1.p1  ORF type:complete len:901 (+),score=203.18 TRINITY_DN666_c1_g1_i1:95-2797(+)
MQGAGRNVEEFLLGELEKRDQEIVELKRQVVRLQCSLLTAGAGGGGEVKKKDTLPQILLSPTIGVSRNAVERAASTSSLESTYGSEAQSMPPTPTPDVDPEGAFKIRVVSPSPPASALQPKQADLSPFLNIFAHFDPISEVVFEYLGDCHPLMLTCTTLSKKIAHYCTVSLTMFKARYTLEAGVANESAYEFLDSTLFRRRRAMHPKRLGKQQASVALHTFAQCKLKPRFNTIAFNVNSPKIYFKQGPPGLRPENNPIVEARGLNIGVLSTLRSTTQQVDYTSNFAWLQNRNVRLFYPRASVPHMLGMLEAVEKLSIQPETLVMDVCLVKPKWFPGIEYMRQYPNVVLVPEIPSKEALDEGEAQKIRVKFNKYLQSFATAGQCIYVVLDQNIAPEVSKEIKTNKVNVLSLPLPDKEGPIGLREYPLLELLTVLDSVFDNDFTLTVPEEREPLTPGTAVFSPAPGAGGVYKYTKRQAFSFQCSKPRKIVEDDEGGVSDSSNYSASSKGSMSSFDRKSSLSDFFKSLKSGRSRTLTRGQGEHETSPPPRRSSKSGTDQLAEEVTLSVPLSPAEQKATQRIAEEDGFTLSITSADTAAAGNDDFVWHWGKEVPKMASPSSRKLLGVEHICEHASYQTAADGMEPGMQVVSSEDLKGKLHDPTEERFYTPVSRVMRMCNRATQRTAWCGLLTCRDSEEGRKAQDEGVEVNIKEFKGSEYTIVNSTGRGVDVMTVRDALEVLEECVGGYDVLFFDSMFVHNIRQHRRELEGKVVCLDLTDWTLGDTVATVIEDVDVLFMSEAIARHYSPTDDSSLQAIAAAIQSLPGKSRLLLITLSNNSILLASPKGVYMHPFPSTSHLTKPTFSHYSFIGGFLARYCTGKDPEVCIQNGFRQSAASQRDDYLP